MLFETLIYTIENNIAFVKLNRPEKHNAMNMRMFEEINKVITAIKQDCTIRAVIVSGEGEDFCSGIDVKSMFSNKRYALKLLFKWLPWQSNMAQRVSTGWKQLPVPVIFALHGRCWGAGLQIALSADFRYAAPSASLSIMEAKWGLIPDMGGTLGLKELLPIDKAKELAMTAKEISGLEALEINLVTKVCDKPQEEAFNFATQLTTQSPDAIAGCKKLYNNSWWSGDGKALARETWYQLKVFLSQNYRIKSYNQTHSNDEQKDFKPRIKW